VGVGIEIVAETEEIVEQVALAHETVLDFNELAPDHENRKRQQDGVDVSHKLNQNVEAFHFAGGEALARAVQAKTTVDTYAAIRFAVGGKVLPDDQDPVVQAALRWLSGVDPR
jgi:hypothetical protein